MGMVLVVVLEPPVKHRQHGIGTWQRVNTSIIAFDCFNKALGHAIGLWTGDNLAVMHTPGPVGRPAFQQPALHGHDAIDPLVVDGAKASKGSMLVEDAGDTPIAIGRAPVHDPADLGRDIGIIRLAIAAPRTGVAVQSIHQIGAGHVKGVGHGLHGPGSLGSNGNRSSSCT